QQPSMKARAPAENSSNGSVTPAFLGRATASLASAPWACGYASQSAMNSSLLPPKWWYRLPTLDPARSTTSAMLASAKPCPVNTARAASSSARCVCAVLAHCQEPAPALPLDEPVDGPRGGRATGATGHHPFSG